MKLVFFAHPPFSKSNSMPRFLNMLIEGMRERGHQVEVWAPEPRWFRLPAPAAARKWLGYADQFLSFPRQVKQRLRKTAADTLFVFCDQALGPWVPLVAGRPHVVHCHDFLALRSALGEWPQNRLSWTGRQYQKMIRRGFSEAENFISVSHKTQDDLHRLLPRPPRSSTVVYNGLNYPFRPIDAVVRRDLLRALGLEPLETGFILHVGGNQWYKNRAGVLSIYERYAASAPSPLPLWMFGVEPPAGLRAQAAAISRGSVRFVTGATDLQVNAAYADARVLLFPSIAEGFGWPIVEAMAAGCPVLTTNAAPMTEIGGDVAHYLPVPGSGDWAESCAALLSAMLGLPEERLRNMRLAALERATQFSGDAAIDAYEQVYLDIVKTQR